MNKSTNDQFILMTQKPIPPLIARLAIPTIISMLVSAIYSMADTFFVSKLGTAATGAVGIVFSLMAIIQAIGFMIGMGCGATISRLLGRQDNESANTILSSGFFLALAIGFVITICGIIFITPFMRFLGATDTIMPYASSYGIYILLGAPIMCTSFVMNNGLRSEGKAFLSMLGIATGSILNILLDPIFIFVFHMGIAGAAVATLVSQCISFGILLSNYLAKRSNVRISVRYISKKFATYRTIAITGFPSLCRQGLASVANIALNNSAAMFGDPAIAAMSIVGRVFWLILSSLIGFGQGFQPVAGYNFGAKKYKRVKEAVVFCTIVGTVFLAVMGLLGLLFAPHIIALFRKDDLEVIAIASLAFRLQCISMPLQAIVIIANMLFQTIGKSREATFLSVARQGLFFLPLVLILPHTSLGLLGLQSAQMLSDFITFFCCLPLIVHFFHHTPSEA